MGKNKLYRVTVLREIMNLNWSVKNRKKSFFLYKKMQQH